MRVLLLALAACAHRVPVAAPADPELCLHDRDAPARLVAPHGDRVSVCFGIDCLVVDHVAGRVVARAEWPAGAEEAFPPELRIPEPAARFELERTETETAVCEKSGGCRRLRLPGVADQQTQMPAISADGNELYFVARDGGHAYLDTIAVGPAAKRTGRVPLPVATADDHGFSVERVGTAVLVRDSVSVSLDEERSSAYLVDPLTGAKRALLTGTAVALDDTTALVLDGRRATIAATRGLTTRATHVEPGSSKEAPLVAANGAVAVVAFSNPPTIVTVENRRFAHRWRLPVCR